MAGLKGSLFFTWLMVANCIVWTTLDVAWGKIQPEQAGPLIQVMAVLGGVADLPCNLNPPFPEDRILLVLWYRDGIGMPIYSLDARGRPLQEARHWADEATLGGRSFLRPAADPARLSIDHVRLEDEALYRCRVDFKMSPTRNARVNLTVVVPPQPPIVLDENGAEVRSSTVGPYNEGQGLTITCESSGGRPLAKVTWWRENRLLDATAESIVNGVVRNTLRIPSLSRADAGATLTCQASNNNISVPTSAVVTLDMLLRPLEVRMLGDNRPLSADRKYEFVCVATGARPPALITWWKGSTRLQSSRQSISADGNVTSSTLTYVPSLEDGEKMLVCRAEHTLLQQAALEDARKLNIQYVPIAHLELGASLVADNIKEGNDVFFECNVRAHPWINRILWRHNGKQLYHNVSQGVFMSNQTLVLQQVDRKAAGLYTCVASNDEGDGESNAVALHIQYAPVCKGGQQTVYGAAKGELISISCEVEAYPHDVSFRWAFNGTHDFADVPASHYVVDRLRSTLSYRPMTERDYGTLSCWAKNVAGEQREPCTVIVNLTGKPDPPSNCSVSNQTTDSVYVACEMGADNGLPQHFLVEIWDPQGPKALANKSNSSPVFLVKGLEPGQRYGLSIWAVNAKGRSEPVNLLASTVKPAEKEKRTEPIVAPNAVAPVPAPQHGFQLTPVLGTLIGVGSGLLLVALIIVLVMRIRSADDRGRGLSAKFDKAAVPLRSDAEAFDLKEKGVQSMKKVDFDTRDEEERAFDKIRTISEPRKLQSPITNAVKMDSDIMYAELSLVSNSGPPKPPRQGDPTVYAQIDHTRSPVHLSSGYVRLPPVDQFQLLPFADGPTPSPSEAVKNPQVWPQPKSPQLQIPGGDTRTLTKMKQPTASLKRRSNIGEVYSSGTPANETNPATMPLPSISSRTGNEPVSVVNETSWKQPLGTTRL